MRLFVTGTDTGVGKTVVTACLAAAARRRGSVVACKPVASGVPPGEVGEDAELLGRCAGHPPLVLAAFEAPLSPHRAAMLEGRQVGDEVLEQIRALQADTVLVEGVGGWRVPLRIDGSGQTTDLPEGAGTIAAEPDSATGRAGLAKVAERPPLPEGEGGGEGPAIGRPLWVEDLARAGLAKVAERPPLPEGVGTIAAEPDSAMGRSVLATEARRPPLPEGEGGGEGPAIGRPLWVEDLARATGGPVLVVAADRLGVLNHTLLTLDAIRAAGLQVAAVVLNRGAVAAPDDRSRTTNAADLRLLAGAPIVEVPPVDLADPTAIAAVGELVLRGIVGPAVGECG